jgi:hypothetical protein
MAAPAPPLASQGALDQFLQPQSMVTPGALGALAMLGTNTLAGNFSYVSYPFIALILSCLFGFAALVKSTSIFEKILYYLLNSIIIFSVAAGSNKLGQQVQQHASLSLPSLAAYAEPNFRTDAWVPSPQKIQFFKEWFPPSSRPTAPPPRPRPTDKHVPDNPTTTTSPMTGTSPTDQHNPTTGTIPPRP